MIAKSNQQKFIENKPIHRNMGDEWTKLYGEVVWAKTGSYPWWPSYVFDPDLILHTEKDKEAREKGKNSIGKQYVVLFYADNTFGFIPSKNMKPFECPEKESMLKQTIGKRYQDNFQKAVETAQAELSLEVPKRLQWYLKFSEVQEDLDENEGEDIYDEDNSEEDSVEKVAITKQKRGRKSLPAKDEIEELSEEEVVEEEKSVSLASGKESDDDSKLQKPRKRPDVAPIVGPKRGRKPKKSIIASDDEEGSSEDEKTETKAKKPRKSIEKATTTSKVTPSKSTTTIDGSSAADKRGRGRPPKLTLPTTTKENGSSLTKLTPITKTTTTSAASKQTVHKHSHANSTTTTKNNHPPPPEKVSLEQIRDLLHTLLNAEPLDEDKILKVFKKMALLTVTLDELRSSGLGKAVATLRKHAKESIKVAAIELSNQWKVMLSSATAVTPTTPAAPTTAPSIAVTTNNINTNTTSDNSLTIPSSMLQHIPPEILSHPLRLRAFKLLYSILHDLSITSEVEGMFAHTYLTPSPSNAPAPTPVPVPHPTAAAHYLQSITRVYALIKGKVTISPDTAIDWLRAQLPSNTNTKNEATTTLISMITLIA